MESSPETVRAFDMANEPVEVSQDIELIDIKELCRLLGGSRPVHPCTAYRLIQRGKLPPANKRLRRWVKAPVVDAIKALIEESN